ncbi:MAG: zinc metalloprotease HtpX [Promicromonosporaceae bacterium]|nr:zinc metalloprotease HtpX [Promicromonosporaceae bacterium]
MDNRLRHLNGMKTATLFGVMWAILLGLGWLVGDGNLGILGVFAAFGLGMTFFGYWNSARIAIRSMRAVEVSEVEQPAMHRIVRELSAAAGQPMPRLYVSPTMSPNAFATGRNPKNAAVCCTQGILAILDERELRGVLGHELMHVYNRDILTGSVAAALAGVIAMFARVLMFGGGRDRRGGSPILQILTIILVPIAAMIIQLAISRTREFSADEGGARLTGDPLALASALRKLDRGVQAAPLPDDPRLEAVSHMMLANPFRRGGGMSRMFATHPAMDERIRRLEAMTGGQATDSGAIIY